MDENNDESIRFTDRLIKGKIVEELFRQLFQHDKKYSIIPLGYEYRLPELVLHMQKPHRVLIDRITTKLKSAPDFLVMANNGDQLYLVEVKYHAIIKPDRILHNAKEIHEQWDYSWLFIATPSGFYFQSCREIIENNGQIVPLGEKWSGLTPELMQKYLQILNTYIKPLEGSEEIDVHRYIQEN